MVSTKAIVGALLSLSALSFISYHAVIPFFICRPGTYCSLPRDGSVIMVNMERMTAVHVAKIHRGVLTGYGSRIKPDHKTGEFTFAPPLHKDLLEADAIITLKSDSIEIAKGGNSYELRPEHCMYTLKTSTVLYGNVSNSVSNFTGNSQSVNVTLNDKGEMTLNVTSSASEAVTCTGNISSGIKCPVLAGDLQKTSDTVMVALTRRGLIVSMTSIEVRNEEDMPMRRYCKVEDDLTVALSAYKGVTKGHIFKGEKHDMYTMVSKTKLPDPKTLLSRWSVVHVDTVASGKYDLLYCDPASIAMPPVSHEHMISKLTGTFCSKDLKSEYTFDGSWLVKVGSDSVYMYLDKSSESVDKDGTKRFGILIGATKLTLASDADDTVQLVGFQACPTSKVVKANT